MNLTLEKTWKNALAKEFERDYFNQLMSFVNFEYRKFPDQVFPEEKFMFRAFDLCALQEVKVVILGQDPYPTKGHAHGLAFSVDKSVKPLPKSLQNIYKELQSDISIAAPLNGELLHWAEQGVLLLNTVLTVHEGRPDGHSGKGWERFTDAVLTAVNRHTENTVFILWGAKAQAKAPLIDVDKHFIIQSPHPSPLSAHRGFFGSKPFSRTNAYLIDHGKKPIIW
jgi:uracil-DNA glycosylase